MTLVTGEIVEIYQNGFSHMGKIRVSGAFIRVPLMLLPEARVGDLVLVEGGVGIGLVGRRPVEPKNEKEGP